MLGKKRKDKKAAKHVETAYGYSSETDHLVEFNKPQPKKKSRRRVCCVFIVVLLLLFLALGALGIGVGLGLNYGLQSVTFQDRITTNNLMKHLQDLEKIAQDYGETHGNFSRAVQYGYNKSAEMIINRLKNAGYSNIVKQIFQIATYEDKGGASLRSSFNDGGFLYDFIKDSQFSVMRYSNTTEGLEIEGNLSIVEESCVADNYTEGTIALVDYIHFVNSKESECTLLEMTEAAYSAGVIGMIMMRTENSSSSGPPSSRIYYQDTDSISVSPVPVLGVTYAAGTLLKDYLDLSNTGTVQVYLSTNTLVEFWDTYNVLAYTSNHEKEGSMIVVGSHLDSVAAGPGINDNGSGSAANLELAIQVIKQNVVPVNQVLFAFWGAEELGLLGSSHYVNELSKDERAGIALNLNYDMIGSPNYVRQIYNGSGATNENIVKESLKIQKLFQEYFESRNIAYDLTEFNGRSDYGPFIAEGVDIPAGGLATGADEVKSEDERSRFGGVANAIMDPCYHQSCDTVENINQEVYLEMSQAAGYVLNILMLKDDLRAFLKG